MTRPSLIFLVTFTLLLSCDQSGDKSIDKSLVSNVEKLNSPFGEFNLYRYSIEGSMAFTSRSTVIKIMPADKKCDFTDSDFLRFGNDHPFWIKWKSKDTLSVKCVVADDELANKQPTMREIKKWKEFYFEIEYCSLLSTSAEISDSLQNYFIDKDFITIRSKTDTLKFKKAEMQLSLDSNHLYIMNFKIDMFNYEAGLATKYYALKLNDAYRQSDLLNQQAFLKVRP